LVPSFAVGRGQDVITILSDSNIDAPIYLDGMLWDATAIHTAYPEFLCKKVQTQILHKGNNPFIDPRLKGIGSQKERRELLDSTHPAVVVATSGMLSGGPVMEYLNEFAGNPKNTLVFVGYQAEGTTGRRIQKGWKDVQLDNGKMLELKLEIATVEGLSGHSDHDQLMKFIGSLQNKPRKIIVNHGENTRCVELARSVHRAFKVETLSPKNLETMRLK
jgi:predicted metal-dependent RNase